MAPRFYVYTDFTANTIVVLPEKTAHHASRTLRMREGDEATLFDGRGNEARVVMHFSSSATTAEVIEVTQSTNESPVTTTLIQSLVSQEKLDWIIEKATELGVTEIVLVPAARSVTKLDDKRLQKRLEQWRKTVIAACEQCTRSRFPTVTWQPTLKTALTAVTSAKKIILAPGATNKLDFGQVSSITFAVGPEGGFSAEEIALAQTLGFEPQLMGPRVLRTETAGLAALAVTQWTLGDFS